MKEGGNRTDGARSKVSPSRLGFAHIRSIFVYKFFEDSSPQRENKAAISSPLLREHVLFWCRE